MTAGRLYIGNIGWTELQLSSNLLPSWCHVIHDVDPLHITTLLVSVLEAGQCVKIQRRCFCIGVCIIIKRTPSLSMIIPVCCFGRGLCTALAAASDLVPPQYLILTSLAADSSPILSRASARSRHEASGNRANQRSNMADFCLGIPCIWYCTSIALSSEGGSPSSVPRGCQSVTFLTASSKSRTEGDPVRWYRR